MEVQTSECVCCSLSCDYLVRITYFILPRLDEESEWSVFFLFTNRFACTNKTLGVTHPRISGQCMYRQEGKGFLVRENLT